MNARLIRQLIRFYPPEWRLRYGEEFQGLLETYPSNPRTIVDVIGAAARERILSIRRFKMDRRQNSLALMLYASLAAIAAGINFYWTVDDTRLAAAMSNYSALFTSWNLVRAGSLLALVAFAAIGAPVFLSILKTAWAARRWDVVRRLAVAPCAGLVTLAWMFAATRFSGGHWVPTPWDVTGDWVAPHAWPPPATRWALSSVTFILMTAGIIVSAISLREAIRRSDLTKHRLLWFKTSSMLLASAIAAMAIGMLAWGWFAQQYAASDFHVRDGGLFSSTNFASWFASCIVFLAATVMAVKGARSALALPAE